MRDIEFVQDKSGVAYDVFNGDADGICALHQLRLVYPLTATLITGVKRDIRLLERVQASHGDQITVLDISLDANISALNRHLDAGASILYFDHHTAKEVRPHEHLKLFLDEAPDVCTSILVSRYIGDRHFAWAIAAAFGDNLVDVAQSMCQQFGLSQQQGEQLQMLGKLFNYNGYGEKIEDLHIHPAALYRALQPFVDPFEFIAESSEFALLRKAYAADLACVSELRPERESKTAAMYVLPDEPWALRMSGVLANMLKQQSRDKSFAVLSTKAEGGFIVSIRSAAPEHCPASTFCSGFATGGGRQSAGGINHLAETGVEDFAQRFFAYF